MGVVSEFIKYSRKEGVRKAIEAYGKIALGIADYEENINTLYYFLNQYADISKIPHAEGELRQVQLSNTALLKVIDKLCTKNNLIYFTFSGTLLGAVRHQGFIPWDDDLDVAMPRESFERAKGILRDFAEANGMKHWIYPNPYFESLGLGYKDAGVWCDFFPIDTFCCTEKITKEDFDFKVNLYKKEVNDKQMTDWYQIGMIRQRIFDDNREGNRYYYYCAPRCNHPTIFLKTEDVFSIQRIAFENIEVNAPNKVEQFLSQLYGNDWMKFPKTGILHHSDGHYPDPERQIQYQKELAEIADRI